MSIKKRRPTKSALASAKSATVPEREIIGADSNPPADTPKRKADRRLYIDYIQATQVGGEPTVRQKRGAQRWQTYVEEYRRDRCLRTVPKSVYLTLAGRPARTVNDQADRHEIPMGDAVVNLYEVVKSFHDLLAKHKVVLARADKPDTNGEAQTKYAELLREENWRIAMLRRKAMERELLPREQVRESLLAFSTLMRTSIDTLQRQCGPMAVEVMNEMLSDWSTLIQSWNTEVDERPVVVVEAE